MPKARMDAYMATNPYVYRCETRVYPGVSARDVDVATIAHLAMLVKTATMLKHRR